MPELSAERLIRLDRAAPELRNLYHLARLSLVAYDTAAGHPPRDLREAFDLYHPIVTRDLCGYVAANADHVALVFRGSSQEREWTRGRHFDLVSAGAGRAHEGFTKLLDAIWQPLMAILYDTAAAEKHLWLSGHSMGGALALIAALRLEHFGFEPAMVGTFGSPRVLDAAAAAALRTPVLRVENADDPVPHVPWPSMGYAHAGKAIRLMPTGALAEARHSERLARRLDRVNELFEGRVNSGMRHDHQMREYVRKLERYA